MNVLQGFERCPWCQWSGVARIYGVEVTCMCPRGMVAGAGLVGTGAPGVDHGWSDGRGAGRVG